MADAPPKYEFAKLELKPGDILAIKSKVPLVRAQIDDIRAVAEKRIPEGVLVLVVGPDLDLATITREQLDGVVEGKAKLARSKKVKAEE